MVRLVPRAVRVLVAARVTIVRRPDLAIARFDSKDNLRIGLVCQSTSAVEQLRPYHCRVLAISDEDSVSAGVLVSAAVGYPAFVLNFASKNVPGGAVGSGVLAQEECIFRQTTLALALPPEV